MASLTLWHASLWLAQKALPLMYQANTLDYMKFGLYVSDRIGLVSAARAYTLRFYTSEKKIVMIEIGGCDVGPLGTFDLIDVW
jgi:glycogen synthase